MTKWMKASRRKTGSCLVCLGVMVAILIAACGPAATPAPEEPTEPPAAGEPTEAPQVEEPTEMTEPEAEPPATAAPPQIEGGPELVLTTSDPVGSVEEVSWMLPQEPVTFDTDLDASTSEDTVVANVCERLFLVQPDMSIRPWLAESYNQPDDTTYVFNVRQGVTFHNGDPLTAEDVVWSLQRHADPGAEESDEFELVTSIEQTGDWEVTVTLDQPNIQFLLAMAADGGIILNREQVEAAGEDYGTAGSDDACTGPYTISEWVAGSSLTLESYEGYWSDEFDGRPSEVTFLWGGDAVIVNRLNTGETDGVFLSTPLLVPAVEGNDQIKVYYGPSTFVYSLVPTNGGPEQQVQVRKALSLAIDRAGIAQASFAGMAVPWKAPVGSGSWGYEREAFEAAYADIEDASLSPVESDYEEARRLLDEVQISEPLILASDGSEFRNVASNAIRDAAQRIGLDLEIRTYSEQEHDELYSDAEKRETVNFFIVGWWISKPEPLGFYDNMITGSFNNYMGYSSERYDELFREASSTLDDESRAELVIEMQEIFTDQNLWIPLIQRPNTLLLDAGLTGPPVSDAYLFYPWAAELGTAE